MRITGDGQPARHIRFVLLEATAAACRTFASSRKSSSFSNRNPVSFGAKVSSNQSVEIPGDFSPEFVVDGRTPLGVWQGGLWTSSHGDCLEVPINNQRVEWVIDLGESTSVDRMVFFPYALPELSGPGAVPPRMTVEVADNPEFRNAKPIATTGDRDLPVDLTTPIVMPTSHNPGRYLRVISEKAWRLGIRNLQALGEIEVWSGDRNVAAGREVTTRQDGIEHPSEELTDGSGGSVQILPMHIWLNQLVERSQIDSELEILKGSHVTMASESELNTTWGAAVALGLTFLIPVAIVERRPAWYPDPARQAAQAHRVRPAR